MASSKDPRWPSIEAQEYAAAESMVQHSRSARSNSQALNGFAMPDVQTKYSLENPQASNLVNSMPTVPVPSYNQFRHPFQSNSGQDQSQVFNNSTLSSPHDIPSHFDQQGRDSFSELSQGHNSNASGQVPPDVGGSRHDGQGNRGGSVEGSDPTSPMSTRGFNKHQGHETGSWQHRSGNDGNVQQDVKDESDRKPPWSELKTKAGKERKRLPLACIACRRKKIRCSGEKPSCKHCMRSRIPCVYKVTARKAAPRTDYMAMLDKRLKRMEERVIKIIPKNELPDPSAIPRAIIKPSSSSQANAGKKRGAEEAFGSQLDEWADGKASSSQLNGRITEESKVNTEGAEFLPSSELREHLSEVFFDMLYGQSYHLLHKPSYIRRLR